MHKQLVGIRLSVARCSKHLLKMKFWLPLVSRAALSSISLDGRCSWSKPFQFECDEDVASYAWQQPATYVQFQMLWHFKSLFMWSIVNLNESPGEKVALHSVHYKQLQHITNAVYIVQVSIATSHYEYLISIWWKNSMPKFVGTIV